MKRLHWTSLLMSLSFFGCGGEFDVAPGHHGQLPAESVVGSERTPALTKEASEPRSLTILADQQAWPTRLAVDETHVYWANTGGNGVGGIARVAKAGGAIETLYSSSSGPDSIGLDDEFVYFAERQNPGALLRVPRAGGSSAILRNEASGFTWVLGEDVIYFNDDSGGIHSMPKTGGAETLLVAAAVNTYSPLHVQGGFIYWLQEVGGWQATRLMRASLSSGAPEVVLEEATPRIYTLAFDSQRVYWVTQAFLPKCNRPDPGTGTCERRFLKSASLHDGQTRVLAVVDSLPADLEVDDTHVYWATFDYPSARLQRVAKRGGKVVTLASDLGVVEGIALDEHSIYFANYAEQGRVGRVAK